MFSIDLWHKSWGFGFTIIVWERIDDSLIKLGFEGQIKAFGKSKQGEWYA